MNRDEAAAKSAALNREETGDRHWFPKQVAAEEWEVVSVSGTGFRPRGPLKETSETRPSPSDPPDPRPSIFRNVPPYGAG
ncbi:MAG: hypothetical protein JO363_09970 [Solirubrobacterales bacterium]|nr:hypothetical protein [Solirubrobacterales bacterium]